MIVLCSVVEDRAVEATVVELVLCGVEVVDSGTSEIVFVLVSVEFATVEIDVVRRLSLVVVDVEGSFVFGKSVIVDLTAEVTVSVSVVNTDGDVGRDTSFVVVSDSVVFIVSVFTVVVVESRVEVAASEEEAVSKMDGVVVVEASDCVFLLTVGEDSVVWAVLDDATDVEAMESVLIFVVVELFIVCVSLIVVISVVVVS